MQEQKNNLHWDAKRLYLQAAGGNGFLGRILSVINNNNDVVYLATTSYIGSGPDKPAAEFKTLALAMNAVSDEYSLLQKEDIKPKGERFKDWIFGVFKKKSKNNPYPISYGRSQAGDLWSGDKSLIKASIDGFDASIVTINNRHWGEVYQLQIRENKNPSNYYSRVLPSITQAKDQAKRYIGGSNV